MDIALYFQAGTHVCKSFKYVAVYYTHFLCTPFLERFNNV